MLSDSTGIASVLQISSLDMHWLSDKMGNIERFEHISIKIHIWTQENIDESLLQPTLVTSLFEKKI